jgi:hypothetical protein
MANLRCTECGRYVNSPEDHDKKCPLYGKQEAFVGGPDETTLEPPGEAPVHPGGDSTTTEPPAPPEGTRDLLWQRDEASNLTYADVLDVGTTAIVEFLIGQGYGVIEDRRGLTPLVRMQEPGSGDVLVLRPTDLLVRDPRGGFYAVERQAVFPT